MTMELHDLENIHKGKPGYIVGKGASLEFLTREYFIAGTPILCMNESIVMVQDMELDNPLYSLQKDGQLPHMVKPNDDVVLILQNTEGYSRDFFPDHEKRILIDPMADQGFLYQMVMAIRMCIHLAQYMGCASLCLLCCDSLTSGDLRTFDVFTGTAKVTPASEWYEKSIVDVLSDLQNSPHVFVTPAKVFA